MLSDFEVTTSLSNHDSVVLVSKKPSRSTEKKKENSETDHI